MMIKEAVTMEGKTKFREVRTVSASDIRKLCIRNNWYTRGDNDQYEHLQNDLCEQKDNLTTEDIVEIAEDIIAHSEIEHYCSNDELIASVAFEIITRAASVYFECESSKGGDE